MKRCFISINLHEEIKEEIVKLQNELPEFIGKKTEKDNLHLTLKFLGEIEDEKIEEVKEKLKEIKLGKFESKLGEVGVFLPRIVWMHLTGFLELQKKIDNSLKDLFKKEKRFMSHLTIARVKRVRDRKKFLGELKKIQVPEVKFPVDKFYLMESVLGPEKPEYSVIEEFRLD